MAAVKPALLIVARCGRLLAQAAWRAGYRPLVVDAFGDLDTRALALEVQVVEDFQEASLRAAGQALIGRYAPAGWVYGPGVERFPELIATLSRHCPLYGNHAEVVRACGDPARFFRRLQDLGIPFPPVRWTPPRQGDWLLKFPGSGGEGVYRWPGPGRWRGGYFQCRVPGPVHCLAFVAGDGEILWYGFNTLWHRPYNDGRPYGFRGLVNRARLRRAAALEALAYARRLARALELRGWHGLDFVLDGDGCPLVLELNARPGAALAVWGDAWRAGGLAPQLAVCRGLPPPPWRLPPAAGWEILFAPRRLRIGAFAWPGWCADRPPPGTVIPAGAPLCSIGARGRSPRAVVARLAHRRRWLERQLNPTTEVERR